jgi:hypothetical protein
MARLYLHCALCDRKQAEGLLSGAAWARYDVDPAVVGDHPALKGTSLRVCPTCLGRHPDWQQRLASALGLAGTSPAAFEAAP